VPQGETTVIVFAGVPVRPTPRLRSWLASAVNPFVVAADRGAETAVVFGYTPDLLVGDFDSIDSALVETLRAAGTTVASFPIDKDATDGEIALRAALDVEPAALLLVGFLGGPRLDQALANLLMLARLPAGAMLLDEHNACQLLRDGESTAWQAEQDEIVSLVPLGADAVGVSTRGLRWPLVSATLPLGGTWGVSNEPVAVDVGVSLERGLLLVLRHFPLADEPAQPL
jgi:thiamine pyrophosphokinase